MKKYMIFCCILFVLVAFCGCSKIDEDNDFKISSDSITTDNIEQTNLYTVTWRNWNGLVMEVDSNVPYGTMPGYDGELPTRNSLDPRYSYIFTSWSPEISVVTQDVTYVAQYISITNTYTITWQNWDGSILQVDENIPYGTSPSYNGQVPTKDGNERYFYIFDGWEPNISDVTCDITYVAHFSQNINQYTVTFKNYNGDILFTSVVDYGMSAVYVGDVPNRDDENQYSYVFNGWSDNFDVVTSNFDVFAQYDRFTKYEFIYASGESEVVKIAEGDLIEDNLPEHTPTTTKSLTRYYYENWNRDGEYSFIESERMVHLFYIYYEGGYAPNNPGLVEEGDMLILEDPVKVGYNFMGWFIDSQYLNEISVITNIDKDYRLYASWEICTYTITYYLDGGENDTDNPSELTYEDVINLKNATKKGYTFVSWYLDSIMYGNEVDSLKQCARDISLYAKYVANKYTVNLNADGGMFAPHTVTFFYNPPRAYYSGADVVYKQVTLQHNEKLACLDCSLADILDNTSPAFLGWSTTRYHAIRERMGYFYDYYDFDEPITQDLVLYAVWLYPISSYIVPFGHSYSYVKHLRLTDTNSFNDYIDYDTERYIHINTNNKRLSMKVDFDTEQYGYYVEIISSSQGLIYEGQSCSAVFTIDCNYGDVIILRVNHSSRNKVKIQFYDIDLSEIYTTCNNECQTITTTYDADVELQIPEREGYIFSGWYDENDVLFTSGKWVYDHDVNLYAKWSLMS